MRGNNGMVFGSGALIGALGGLIGLGGAEFRLPVLIGGFGFAALEAVILNKAMSLIVVASALPFRAGAVPLTDVFANWPIIANLLGGSVFGAWFGAGWGGEGEPAHQFRDLNPLILPSRFAIAPPDGPRLLPDGEKEIMGIPPVIAVAFPCPGGVSRRKRFFRAICLEMRLRLSCNPHRERADVTGKFPRSVRTGTAACR